MKWIKKLVLRLFIRWFEIEIKPIHISVDLVETESEKRNIERVSRIITKDDYRCAISAYTDAKHGVLILINHNLYILLNKKTKGIKGLEKLVHDYGLINLTEQVVIDGVKHKGYSEYRIIERKKGQYNAS
jgi:type II restriction/modification system DNA methylase subunit YeeA